MQTSHLTLPFLVFELLYKSLHKSIADNKTNGNECTLLSGNYDNSIHNTECIQSVFISTKHQPHGL